VIPDKYHVYDVETFPNVFTMGVSQPSTGDRWMFEISQWQNDSSALIEFLRFLSLSKAQMVGFNNVGFDYPVVHCLMNERPLQTLAGSQYNHQHRLERPVRQQHQ
jgi:hypothetical protein